VAGIGHFGQVAVTEAFLHQSRDCRGGRNAASARRIFFGVSASGDALPCVCSCHIESMLALSPD
jgi:hypothetical protein